MSGLGLVVRQGSLSDMEAALTAAHDEIAEQVRTLLDQVDARVGDWSPTTASRAAEMEYQRRLRDGVDRLTAALETVRSRLAEVREEAHATEVENVALVD